MSDLNNPNYKPGHLLDVMRDKLDAKNDVALSKTLGIDRVTLSKVRNRHLPIGPGLLVVMSEAVDLTIGQLRELMGLAPRMYIGL